MCGEEPGYESMCGEELGMSLWSQFITSCPTNFIVVVTYIGLHLLPPGHVLTCMLNLADDVTIVLGHKVAQGTNHTH